VWGIPLRKTTALFVSIALITLFFGCATIKPMENSKEVVRHIYEKNYNIGINKSSFVGEEVIKVKDYYVINKKLNKIKSNQDFTVSVTGLSYAANKGEVFNILGIIEEDDGLKYVTTFPGMTHIKFLINSNGTISSRIIGEMNQTFIVSPKVNPSNTTLEVVSVDEISSQGGYENYEIVFTGISEKNINLLYREYSREGVARVAFYQNLTYPIDSKKIRHKNIVLSVIEITAEKIDYIVVQDGLVGGK
jgi:hypothetical protein